MVCYKILLLKEKQGTETFSEVCVMVDDGIESVSENKLFWVSVGVSKLPKGLKIVVNQLYLKSSKQYAICNTQ